MSDFRYIANTVKLTKTSYLITNKLLFGTCYTKLPVSKREQGTG